MPKQRNTPVLVIGVAVYNNGAYERVVVETCLTTSPEDCAAFEFNSREEAASFIRDAMLARAVP